MRRFVIGKTCSRRAIVGVILAFALAALAICTGGGALAAGPLKENPYLRAAFALGACALLCCLVLQQMVLGSRYWSLDETWVRYRSSNVTADWPRYVARVLLGREPDVDVRLRTDSIATVELDWTWRVAAMTGSRFAAVPFTAYTVWVTLRLRDGSTVRFPDLTADAETLRQALDYLTARPGVALHDPDNLRATLSLTSEERYAYLEKLRQTSGPDHAEFPEQRGWSA